MGTVRTGTVPSRGVRVVATVVAVGWAVLATSLLLPQRIVQTHWAFGTETEQRARATLLIDTRGGPLRLVGSNPGGSTLGGMAGRGFRFEGSIRAGRSGATTVRLVDPSGAVAWSRTAEARGSEPIPSTILTTEGVWRLEIDGRGKAVWVELTGDLETSRWGSVPWGSTLPIAWIAAGILAAVAVWCGVWGARASGLVLLLAGLTMPVLTRGIRDLFSDLPPGEPAMILATALLSTCGAVVLGSTWPHPGARTVGVVAIVVGSALIAAGFAAMRSSDPCVENPCLPFERLDELVAEAGMAIGLIVLAVGGWRLGRAWARPVRLAAGETRPGVGAAGA